jgi:hypothetical protein
LFLIMRLGCGAHMGRAHRASSSDHAAQASRPPAAHSASLGSVSSGNASAAKSNASLLETAGDASPGNGKGHRHGCC